MVEKRNWTRITWTTDLKTSDTRTNQAVTSNARMRNISKTGFAFISEEALSRGVTYRFQIQVQRMPLPVIGKVIHVRNEGTYFLIGVRIESIPFLEKARFNRFLSGQTKQLDNLFFAYSLAGGLLVGFIFYFLFGTSLALGMTVTAVTTTLLFLIKPF